MSNLLGSLRIKNKPNTRKLTSGSSDYLQEIMISDIVIDTDRNYTFIDEIDFSTKNKVFSSSALDLNDIRFTKYYEMKSLQHGEIYNQRKPWYVRCFRRLMKAPNEKTHLTQMQLIEIKQRNLLDDFAYEYVKEETSWLSRWVMWMMNYLKVFEPESYFYLTWQVLNTLMVLILCIEIPIVTFFEVSFTSGHDESNYIRSLVAFPVTVFLVDILISFNTGYYFQGKLEMDRKKIALYYISSGLVLDMIPIMAISVQFFSNQSLFYFAIPFFLPKLYELFKFNDNIQNNLRLHKSIQAFQKLFYLLLWMILICNLFACFFYRVGREMNNQGYESWLDIPKGGKQINDQDLYQKYSWAFFWAVTTMITVGYGDISPQNTPEVLVTVVTMFVSCIMFAYSINFIWEVIREANEHSYNFNRQVTAINRYMADNKVSRKLRMKIGGYLSHMWQFDRMRDIILERDIIMKLAPALRDELVYETMGLMLQRTPFFKHNFTHDFLYDLSQDIEEVRYSEGEQIFLQDDHEWDDLSVYYIKHGTVEIYILCGIIKYELCILRDEQSFGSYGFVCGIERTTSARCLAYSRIYKLNRQKFINRIEAYPQDKEYFHQLRSKVIFQKKIKRLGLKCCICQSESHLAYNCDKTHYVVNTIEFIQEQNSHINERRVFFRRKHHKFNALKQNTQIQNEALYMKRYYQHISFNSRSSESEESDDEDLRNSVELKDFSLSIHATENSKQFELVNDSLIYRQTGVFQFTDEKNNVENRSQENLKIKESLSFAERAVSFQNERQKNISIDFDALNDQKVESYTPIVEFQKFKEDLTQERRNSMKSSMFKTSAGLKQKRPQNFVKRKRTESYAPHLAFPSVEQHHQPSSSSNNKILLKKLKKLKDYINNQDGFDIIEDIQLELFNINRQEIPFPQVQTIRKQNEKKDSMVLYDSQDYYFSIDQMTNFENYFPDNNPLTVIKQLKKVHKRNLEKYRRTTRNLGN